MQHFRLLTIARRIKSGVVSIFALAFMRETYEVVLLNRKAASRRKETGNLNLKSKTDLGLAPAALLKLNLVRPIKLLFLSPIVLSLSVFTALVFGLTYLLFTTFPMVFEEQYGFSSGLSGLAYLGLGIGMIFGVILFSKLSDKMLKQQAGGKEMKPEYRLPLMVYVTPVVPIGFFWYGWSAQEHVHWIVPILGTALIGIGSLFVIVSFRLTSSKILVFQMQIPTNSSCLAARPNLPRRRIRPFRRVSACRQYSPTLPIRDFPASCGSSDVQSSWTWVGKHIVGVPGIVTSAYPVAVLQVR